MYLSKQTDYSQIPVDPKEFHVGQEKADDSAEAESTIDEECDGPDQASMHSPI